MPGSIISKKLKMPGLYKSQGQKFNFQETGKKRSENIDLIKYYGCKKIGQTIRNCNQKKVGRSQSVEKMEEECYNAMNNKDTAETCFLTSSKF